MDRNSDVIHHENENYDSTHFPAELQFLHENKDTDHVFDFTAQVKRKMDRNSDVIHHKNDNYDSNNFPAELEFLHDIINTDPALDLLALWHESRDYETPDTQLFDQMLRAPLHKASADDLGRRRLEEEFPNDFEQKQQMEESYLASSFITKNELNTTDIHQDENYKTALDCFLEKDCYRKASDEERKNAARILHEHGQVKRVNKRSNSGFDQQRRFHCDLCLPGMIRTFTTMEGLWRHFCQHLDHYPYKCPFHTCEEGFYRTDKLDKHIKNNHLESG